MYFTKLIPHFSQFTPVRCLLPREGHSKRIVMWRSARLHGQPRHNWGRELLLGEFGALWDPTRLKDPAYSAEKRLAP